MTNLIVAALAFLLLHLLVSGTRLRGVIAGSIGEGAYMGLFSLASVGALIWLGVAFGAARGGPGDVVYWTGNGATRTIQLFLQLIAVMFVVPGILTRNPTSVGQAATSEDQDIVKGMLRITRHPFLWGVAIWAAGHLLVNGDTAALVLFGTFLILALVGPISIDGKRERALGAAWRDFAHKTSNVPFAAIAGGRQSLNIGEIGIWRLAAGVAVFLFLLGAHPHVFGASALP
jgi:uncharacterized membrane protein